MSKINNIIYQFLYSPLLNAFCRGEFLCMVNILSEDFVLSIVDKFVAQFLLNVAKAKGCSSITHLLTHFGADINMQDGCGNTILIFLLLPEGYYYIERLLVEHVVRPGLLYEEVKDGPKLDLTLGEISLLVKKTEKTLDYILNVLIKNSIDLDKRNAEGNSALFYATKSLGILIYGGVLRKLLSSGSDLNAENRVGHNALGDAIRVGCFMDSVSTLISYGATFNVQDKDGYTELMVAAEGGDTLLVDLLVKSDPNIGKNINLRNKDGNTALMCAITEEGLECYVDSLKVLLLHGASIDIRNNDDHNALDRAADYRKHGNYRIFEFLSAFIKEQNIQEQSFVIEPNVVSVQNQERHC